MSAFADLFTDVLVILVWVDLALVAVLVLTCLVRWLAERHGVSRPGPLPEETYSAFTEWDEKRFWRMWERQKRNGTLR